MPLVKRRTTNEQPDTMIPTPEPTDYRRSASRRPAGGRDPRYDAEPEGGIPIHSSRSKSQVRQAHASYDEPVDSLLLSRDTPNPRSARNRYDRDRDEPLADSLIPSPTKANKRDRTAYPRMVEEPDVFLGGRSQGNPPRYDDPDAIALSRSKDNGRSSRYDDPDPIALSRSKEPVRPIPSRYDGDPDAIAQLRSKDNGRAGQSRYEGDPNAIALLRSQDTGRPGQSRFEGDPDAIALLRSKDTVRQHTRYDSDPDDLPPSRTGRTANSRPLPEAPTTIVSTRTGSEAVTRLGSSSTHISSDLSRVHREPPPPPQPTTPEEQYWAARAIHAEALLSAKSEHAVDLRRAAQVDESRRQKEVRAIRAEAAERLQRLERLIIILATIVLVLTAALSYTLLPANQKQEIKSWWSMPHHFTIPILSPFASVVEQETGIMSSRVILACVPFLAVLSFAIVRMVWQSFLANKRVD